MGREAWHLQSGGSFSAEMGPFRLTVEVPDQPPGTARFMVFRLGGTDDPGALILLRKQGDGRCGDGGG